MKESYRGFEISAKREMALGGWENLYYYVLRESDNYFVIDNFTEGDESEEWYVGYLKGKVDEMIANPQAWAEELGLDECVTLD